MTKCLAKAQMEAELDNALKQLELETRKCINRRLKKSGIDKKYSILGKKSVNFDRAYDTFYNNKFSVTVKIRSWLIEAILFATVRDRFCYVDMIKDHTDDYGWIQDDNASSEN